MYGQVARIYDLLYTGTGIKDYPAEADALHALIQESSPHARTLLDVACGTGAHLEIMRRWYTVEGVDLSPEMLEVARSRLPGVPLQVADMRTLDLGRQFDVVMCLFSAIGYLTEPAEIQTAIRRMADHVAPGGVLIVDGWIRPEEWRASYRGGPDVASDDSTMVVRLTFSRRDGDITEMDLHHLVRDASGIEYFVEHHRLALVPTADYVAAFEAAGLEARVVPDYMPSRDRVVGLKPA
ncbi:MAG TPA: class I SAM-dependent methyltransferase [Candidatus Dormibacteraeota bacterium]|nr:class I SAM-dependent methyltransferase [Candidatus Dormibacteraeota bacterium]